MAVLSVENETKNNKIDEKETILETEKSKNVSSTKDLLKKAKEAANQKFALTINKDKTENYSKVNSPISSKLVLKGEESPAWHGQIIRTKLKRTTPETVKKPSKPITTERLCTNKQSLPASRTLFDYYKKVRSEYEDFREIEAVRLQKRLEKFSDSPKNRNFEEYEREIVPWQSDSTTNSCYICLDEFSLINRRHHCRLCGRIICGSTGCMENIPIKLENGMAKDLKSCTKCYKFLFKKPLGSCQKPSSTEEKMNSLFKKIQSLKGLLLETIPRFNEYLLEASVTEARLLKEWRQDAWTLRDTLILYSVHFRSTVQELTELAENEALEKPIFRVFANNLKRAGNEFLQKHMFTLQILDLTNTEADTENTASKCDVTRSSVETQEDGFKGQIKKLFPSLINELFKVSSSSESGLLEFYNDEGDLVPLTDEALDNKESVLKEQLEQLERELRRDADSDEDNDMRESRHQTIKHAINDIKIELDRFSKLKIR